MSARATLTRTAKLLVADQARGRLGPKTQSAIQSHESRPDHVFELVDLIAAEAARKRPDDDLLQAYAVLLAHGLEQLRYDVERNLPATIALVGRLRAHLIARGDGGRIDPTTLLLVLNQFAAAKLDMGDDLRQLMQRLIEQANKSPAGFVEGSGNGTLLSGLARELGHDVFAIHEQLHDNAEAMPDDMRAAMAMATFAEQETSVREAALGFLLNSSQAARAKLAELVETAAPHGVVSPTMLRRMTVMRNWLREPDRPALDAAIAACRSSGVASAAWPKAEVSRVLASGFDGAGAQTVIVVTVTGNKRTLAGLLVKQGFGVRDTWVRRGLRKAEAIKLIEHAGAEIGLAPSSLDYVGQLARGFLATNLQSGVQPPFSLLDFAETVGISDLSPDTATLDQRIAALCAQVDPARLTEDEVLETMHTSGEWPARHDILTTWFEDDAARVLGSRTAPFDKQMAVMLAGPLQARRQRWAELVAWTALSLKLQPGSTVPDGKQWEGFAILARELAGKRPLDQIGLMHVIAHTSIQVMGMDRLLGTREAA